MYSLKTQIFALQTQKALSLIQINTLFLYCLDSMIFTSNSYFFTAAAQGQNDVFLKVHETSAHTNSIRR